MRFYFLQTARRSSIIILEPRGIFGFHLHAHFHLYSVMVSILISAAGQFIPFRFLFIK